MNRTAGAEEQGCVCLPECSSASCRPAMEIKTTEERRLERSQQVNSSQRSRGAESQVRDEGGLGHTGQGQG